MLGSVLWHGLPAEQLKVALTCLLLANYKAAKCFIKGQLFEVPKGSFVTSLAALARDANVSLRTVRTALKNLEQIGFLTNRATKRFREITIADFEVYQGFGNRADKAATKQRQSNDKQTAKETAKQADKAVFDANVLCQEELRTVARAHRQRHRQSDRQRDEIEIDQKLTNIKEEIKKKEEINNDVVSSKQRHRVSKKRDEGDPRIKEFLAFWLDEYQDIYGQPYHIVRGKDGAIVKSLLKTFGLESLKELATEFMLTQDEFLDKAGYTIGTFAMRVNAIAARLGIARKEAE